MTEHNQISYVEYPTRDIQATRAFFGAAFGWEFVDYGPEYICFEKQGLNGGFFSSELCSRTESGGALIVLFSDDLETTQAGVEAAGGSIVKPIFSFPGGRRFHFTEPGGNELAVWGNEPDEKA